MCSAKRARRGFTLTEVMIASAVLSILVLAVMPVIRLSQQGFSSMEARNALKSEGQAAMNRIGHKLVECKRLFENTTADNLFLARAQLSVPALANSRLPGLEETGAISPSSGTFVASSVGNRLFFASVVPPADLTVLDGGGNTETVRIDLYVFNAYHLAGDAAKSVAGQSRRVLREWHSGSYADYNQLSGIPDPTKRANAARSLVNDRGIAFAWDPSTVDVNAAFYAINGGSGALTLQPAHAIAGNSSAEMMRINTGLTLGGFRWGISPNIASTPNPVPQFGTAGGNFPSGFEVVVVGPNSARQVFMRMVMAAEGTFPGTITSEQVLLTTARDLW